jgi:phage portal protein BeeE
MAFWKKEKKELPSGKVIFTNKGLAQWNTRNFDTLAKEGYEQNAVVFACVNKIKKCVSAIEFKAFRDTKEGREELKDHPILKLIYNPNLLQSKQEFLGDLVSYFVLGGNVFIQIFNCI